MPRKNENATRRNKNLGGVLKKGLAGPNVIAFVDRVNAEAPRRREAFVARASEQNRVRPDETPADDQWRKRPARKVAQPRKKSA